uniref:Uncharacterized protein n=1 Tax=Panagrolaimus superbus TaxID=310955 RepID=A0A914Z833_9BILA
MQISPSIAIEFTSKSIAAFYENELYESINSSDNAIDFKTVETLKVFKTRLQELRLPEKVKGQKDTFWTIGIPDNTSQEARKLILKAVEDFRRQPPTPPNSDIAYIDGDEVSKTIPDSKDQLPPPPIRLINRSTAGAISYLQSLRDGERARHDSEYDIGPYLPDRHFMVIIIDEYFVYGAQFKTINGVVQHKKSYSFEKELFEKVIKRHENSDEEEEHRIRSLKSLWAVIISDGIQAKNKNKFSKMSVVFTYNTKSYIIKNSEFDPIPEEFVYSPADKFSHFPSINGNAYQWPHPEKFILKGINVKSRMLAGDADMH